MNSHDKQSTANTTSADKGGSWQFKFVIFVIAVGVLGLIGKVFGLF
jgi:hypothetical protein